MGFESESSSSDDEEDGENDDENLGQTAKQRSTGRLSSSSAAAAASVVTWREYASVWQRYPMFRAYLLSHLCQHMGDWFVRVASLLVVEQLSSSGKALSHLVLAVMLPKTIFAQVGGYLADRYDRRHIMIALDALAAVAVLGYLVAVRHQSLPLLYLVSAVRSAIGAAYYPATTGLVPLLVPNARDLQLAVTMNGWAWSVMAILGGTLAGSATAVIGLPACYLLDSVTFAVSALVLYYGVQGNYAVRAPSDTVGAEAASSIEFRPTGEPPLGVKATAPLSSSRLSSSYNSFHQLATYLWNCNFGWLVLMKASAGLVWGPEDIVGVQYATIRDALGHENESATAWRTGLLFSVIGIGTLVGPAVSNLWTNGNRPITLQRASWFGLVVLTIGWLLVSLAPSYAWFLVSTLLRTLGSGMVWVNSTVTLQTLTDPTMLGRVLAVEYTSYTLVEASSAALSGALLDVGLSKNQLALVGAGLGGVMVVAWGHYHWTGQGAANPRFNPDTATTLQDGPVSSLELSSVVGFESNEAKDDLRQKSAICLRV